MMNISEIKYPPSKKIKLKIFLMIFSNKGHAATGTVVEALRYKSEGRGIDSRLCH
jgi:hypothetical protein